MNLISDQFMGNLFKFIYFDIESFASAAHYLRVRKTCYIYYEKKTDIKLSKGCAKAIEVTVVIVII